MLRVAICDDDAYVGKMVEQCLTTYSIKYDMEYVFRYFSTSDELLATTFDYSILILDIGLEAGTDGISVGLQLREKGCKAVFILLTSIPDRTYDGYSANVLRYIIKPIEQEEFDEAINAALGLFDHHPRVLQICFNQRTDYIPYGEIVVVDSYLRKRYVYTKRQKYQTSEQWGTLAAHFQDEPAFYKAQKYVIINLGHVVNNTRQQIVMANGREILLPKRQYPDFSKRLNDYMKNKR